MQEVSGSIPLFSTKKALYFAGSTVLFFFTEADFWGLYCFACTVFRLLQAVPIQPPIFDFTSFSKRNVCRPVVQQTAASSPSMYSVRSKLNVILSRSVSVVVESLLTLLGTPHSDAVSHRPFYNNRRFICDASDSVEHEHQQNVKLAFSGIIFVRLRS